MRSLAAALAVLVVLAGGPARAEERIELASRAGVVQPIYYLPAAAPVASVILLPGGHGVVAQVQKNFLLRVRGQFVEQGLSVAVLDAPSDHREGMGPPFRATPQHAQEIAAVVAFLKQKAPVPVWLVGTSNGSISAANAAARLGPGQMAGVVLTSSVWSGGMSAVPIGEIAVPILVVHNRDDGCPGAPYAGAEQAMPQFARAPVKELLAVSGGMSQSPPCDAMSHHGYLGIEDKVVPPIILWIKAHRPAG
jgi:pimeloyl-ACP methyl ester carboxylesterase